MVDLEGQLEQHTFRPGPMIMVHPPSSDGNGFTVYESVSSEGEGASIYNQHVQGELYNLPLSNTQKLQQQAEKLLEGEECEDNNDHLLEETYRHGYILNSSDLE